MRVDLAPGQSATVLIGTPAVCAGAGQPAVASSVRLTLADGESVTVAGTLIDTRCGAPAVIAFEPGAAPAPAPGPLRTLRASLAAPRATARGAVLAYRVTLANPSATPIALSPCPSYTQVLGAGTAAVQRTLLLNCRAVAAIAGGAALTYEMRIAVPASAATGATKLSWELEVPGGPVLGTAISVA